MQRVLHPLRASIVGIGAAAILMAILSLSLAGREWCEERISEAWTWASRMPARHQGRALARADFAKGVHRVYCSHFLGWPLGLNYHEPAEPILACAISYWRVRPDDPRNIHVVDAPDPYTRPAPTGLPAWADELSCVLRGGRRVGFPVIAIRRSEDPPVEPVEVWMLAYNREMVSLLFQASDSVASEP